MKRKKKWNQYLQKVVLLIYYQAQKQYFRIKLLEKEEENDKKEGKMDTRKYTLQFDIY